MDLNGFKALNDAEGHAAGDRVLKTAADAWLGELRVSDTLARVGGDEFAALLPDCDERDAVPLAARLRRAVPHRAGAGVGIAVWDGSEDAATLLRRADQALYADKARRAADRIGNPERLAAVAATGLLGGAAAPELDALAHAVAVSLHVPIATVTLVGDTRQVFAGHCGLEPELAQQGTPLARSLCRHAVSTGRPLVIADMRESPLAAGNPAVLDLGVTAYAGFPLLHRDGHVLGALCAIDRRRRDWSEDDLLALGQFAEQAALELERAALAGVR